VAVPSAEVLVEFTSGELDISFGLEKYLISDHAGAHGFADSRRQLINSRHAQIACASLRDARSAWRLGLGQPMP
jgi:hypothetical protein